MVGQAGNSCSLSPHPDKEEAGRTWCWKIFLRPARAAFYIMGPLGSLKSHFRVRRWFFLLSREQFLHSSNKKRGKLWLIGKKSIRLLVPVNPFIIIERLAISLLCGQVANINYAEHMLPPGGGYQFSFGEHNRKYQFSFGEHNRNFQFSFGEHNKKY